MTSIEQLAGVPFFHGLDATALADIAQAAHVQHVAQDAILFHQDDPATTFALLINGHARLSQVTPDGHQIILGFLGSGQVVGILAVIEHAEYPLTLQAVTDCVALTWMGSCRVAPAAGTLPATCAACAAYGGRTLRAVAKPVS